MTKALQHIIGLPNQGQVKNKPEELIADNFSPYSRNMEFYNELCQGRYGLVKFSSTELSGPVLTRAILKDILGNEYLVFCTTKDIYSYNFGSSRFDIITPTYTTGTIEVKTGELNKVYGSGTPAWATNLKAGDFIKIGSGSVHTGSTWYEIQTVDSATLLTLATNAPVTAASTAYVARQTFTGGDNDIWDWTQFSDDVKGEVIILTNGTEFVYWTGSGQVVFITGVPTGFLGCRYISSYAGRVIVGYTTEGGGDQRQRSRWSGVANCLSWGDSDFIDLADEPTGISGITKFNNYLVIFKDREAYVGRYVGGDYYFEFELSAQAYGCRAPFSIVTRNDYVYYYGHDKKFHRFNLLQDDVISEQIFPETKEFDPTYDEFIQGFNVAKLNEVRWFCPYGSTTQNNYTFVWNYQQNVPQVWEYYSSDYTCSFGSYSRTGGIYADDPVYGIQYADETTGYADDSQALIGSEIVLYGGYDGYVRIADSGTLDDGNNYTRTFRLKRLNFGLLASMKRLWKQIFWLEASAIGSVLIRIRLGDKTTFESTSHTVSLIPDSADQDIIKYPITWDKESQDFQPEISSAYHFSVMAIISLFFPKKRSWRT